jgi:pentatricopeptide repeat protein
MSPSSTVFESINVLWDAIGMEASLLMFFCLGFFLFNSSAVHSRLAKKPSKGVAKEITSGNHEEVVAHAQGCKTLSLDAIVCGVQSFVDNGLAADLAAWLDEALPKADGLSADFAKQVLQLVPKLQLSAVAKAFSKFGVPGEELAAQRYAEDGDFTAVEKMLAGGAKCGAKTFVTLIKELLLVKDFAGAHTQMRRMQQQGFFVATGLTTQLFKLGLREGRGNEVLEMLGELDLAPDAWAPVLECCVREKSPLLQPAVAICEQGAGGQEAVVKAFAKAGDRRAFATFDQLQPSAPLCAQVALLCVEGRTVPLAEHILSYARMEAKQSLALYSAVLKVHTAAREHGKACALYDQLNADGLEPDTVLCGGLIKAAVECGRIELSQQLLRKSGTLDIQNYMALFRTCGRERNAKRALTLLGELEASPVQADVVAYNCVLDVCIKCGDRRSAHGLFQKMLGLEMVDVISFNTMLKLGSSVDTSELLQQMHKLSLKPNQVTYNSLINASVSRGDLARAWAFVAEMEQQGIQIDNFTCSIMMKALKQSSSKEDVDKTLGLIERSHVHPDEVLVNTLLDACLRLRDVQRLTSALNLFRRSGVVPGEASYGTLIRAYGQAKCLPEARALWEDMLSRKVRPSESTFAGMIDACVANGALEEALEVVRKMQELAPGFLTPVVTYTALIKAFAQRSQLHHVVQVYEDMKKSGVQFDLVLYNCLIDCFARVADMERTATLFQEMCTAGVAPDLITYSTVIKGYCVAGDLEQAIQLFTLMRKRQIVPDAAVFNAILDGCARKGMPPLAEQVLSDMRASAIAPSNTTLCILVKMYGKAHDLETALKLVDEVPAQHGFEANNQVLTCLAAACVNNGRMPLALETFDRMKHPDAKAYATLASGCLKASDVDGALGLVELALDRKCRLDQDLVDAVLQVAKRRGGKVQPLTHRLRDQGYSLKQ